MIPKGIRTRATPDWFAQFMSMGGHGVPINSGLNDYQQISLYNDSNIGALLFVWGISSVASNNDYFDVATIQGTIGTLQRGCQRINPSLGAPPGQIYYSNDPSNPIPITPTSFYCEFDPANLSGSGPLYIVPPGYSLVFVGPQKDAEMMINLWYMPMIDVKGYKPV